MKQPLLFAAVCVLACGGLTPSSSEMVAESGSIESESDTGGSGPQALEGCPEAAAEAFAGLERMRAGAVAFFDVERPIVDAPDVPLHRCPHFESLPTGPVDSRAVPSILVACGDHPSDKCVPCDFDEGCVGGAATYPPVLWEGNDVFVGLGFSMTEPHWFHYAFRADNAESGDGACQFTAQAWADLDDDFDFSTYEVTGTLSADNRGWSEVVFVDPCE